MIPYENLKKLNSSFEQKFTAKFNQFIASGWYILGEEVSSFEQEFAAFHGQPHAVGVANGLDALILSIKACGFKRGSEIIVPSNTYIATILAIIHCDMIPILVEPDITTYNIDPDKIEQEITPKTIAIMVVHLYGQCCDMDPIMEIATRYQLRVIEDCAQAHGATYKERIAGAFGDFGAFSFYPTKNLGALGDAGAIICKSETQMKLLKQMRNYGSEQKYHNGIVGYNSRLDEIQASFLRIKLPALDTINNHKKQLAQIYLRELNDSFIKPVVSKDYENVYHIFNIRHPERDRLKAFLTDHQIGTEIHYPVAPQHQKALKNKLKKFDYPISEEIHHTTLSLPCSFAHTIQEIKHVCEILNSFK